VNELELGVGKNWSIEMWGLEMCLLQCKPLQVCS
jgi:hypothetical protein